MKFREDWNGNITTTLFSYFSIRELVHLSEVCRIFNEITGSKSILSQFNGRKTWIHTIDRIFPDVSRDSFSNEQGMNGNNVTYLSENDEYIPYIYEVKNKELSKSKRSYERLRVNSISPVSINSSNQDNDYDIIRDEVGYAHL